MTERIEHIKKKMDLLVAANNRSFVEIIDLSSLYLYDEQI
mgnify:CR=1 FL=1|jgi:hypothetical protein